MTTESFDKNTIFTAVCELSHNSQYTGFFFKINSGDTNLPLIYDSSNSNVPEEDVSDITISPNGVELLSFDPISNNIPINEVTSNDIQETHCYVGYTYSGRTPNVEPTSEPGSEYNAINYTMNYFKGCRKIVYHDLNGTAVKYKYSSVNNTIYHDYIDVFGTNVSISGWSTVQGGTPSVTPSSPFATSVSDCYTQASTSTPPVIELYPVIQTYTLNVYPGTQITCSIANEIKLYDENDILIVSGTDSGISQAIISQTNLQSGNYKLVITHSTLISEGVGVYGWDNGHKPVPTDWSLVNVLTDQDGNAYGEIYEFYLSEDSEYTVYINKSYEVKIYSGFDSNNNTVNSTQMITSDKRTMNQLVPPRTYNTWSEPEYLQASNNITRTGYVLSGLRYYYYYGNPIDYNIGSTIPQFAEDRNYIMLWKPIEFNISNKVVSYDVTDCGKELMADTVAEITSILPSMPMVYNDNLSITTNLKQDYDSEKYFNYFKLETNYKKVYPDGLTEQKPTFISKGDILLGGADYPRITFDFYNDGGELETAEAHGFQYDGISEVTVDDVEIFRPHSKITNNFVGWSVDNGVTIDPWFDQYTTIDNTIQRATLDIPLNNDLYVHLNGNTTINIVAVYEHNEKVSIPTRVYYPHYNADEIRFDFIDYSSGRAANVATTITGDLASLLSEEDGITSTSRENWTLGYFSDNTALRPIFEIGEFTDVQTNIVIKSNDQIEYKDVVQEPHIYDDSAQRFIMQVENNE